MSVAFKMQNIPLLNLIVIIAIVRNATSSSCPSSALIPFAFTSTTTNNHNTPLLPSEIPKQNTLPLSLSKNSNNFHPPVNASSVSPLHAADRGGGGNGGGEDLYRNIVMKDVQTRRNRLQKQKQKKKKKQKMQVAVAPRPEDDENNVIKMRLKLQKLEEEIQQQKSKEDIQTLQKGMQKDINDLKSELTQTKQEVENAELRANEAERRVTSLQNELLQNNNKQPINEQLQNQEARHSKQVQNLQKSFFLEKKTMRQKAWSLETELSKQKYVLAISQRELNKTKQRLTELESLETDYATRLSQLTQELADTKDVLQRTRKRSLSRFQAQKSIFQRKLQQKDVEMETKLAALRQEMEAELQQTKTNAQTEINTLKKEMIHILAKSKVDKWTSLSAQQEKYDALKAEVEEEFQKAKVEMEEQVSTIRQEMNTKLAEAKNKSEKEKKAIQQAGKLALSMAQADHARKLMTLKKEMEARIEAEEMNRIKLEETVVKQKLVVRGYKMERRSLRRTSRRLVLLLWERIRGVVVRGGGKNNGGK